MSDPFEAQLRARIDAVASRYAMPEAAREALWQAIEPSVRVRPSPESNPGSSPDSNPDSNPHVTPPPFSSVELSGLSMSLPPSDDDAPRVRRIYPIGERFDGASDAIEASELDDDALLDPEDWDAAPLATPDQALRRESLNSPDPDETGFGVPLHVQAVVPRPAQADPDITIDMPVDELYGAQKPGESRPEAPFSPISSTISSGIPISVLQEAGRAIASGPGSLEVRISQRSAGRSAPAPEPPPGLPPRLAESFRGRDTSIHLAEGALPSEYGFSQASHARARGLAPVDDDQTGVMEAPGLEAPSRLESRHRLQPLPSPSTPGPEPAATPHSSATHSALSPGRSSEARGPGSGNESRPGTSSRPPAPHKPSPLPMGAGEPLETRERRARYIDLGLLGVGAMGEVRRVLDRDLNRTMAMKILKPGLLSNRTAQNRFLEEAQATAQLQHPGVVPVHELGRLVDGRYYFTMKEVRGQTLRHVIQAVHAVSRERWESVAAADGGPPWTFRRLVEMFRKVAEAVAYAHSRGVTHRDIKPANVMVGDFGEVLVLDWGLAKIRENRAGARQPASHGRSDTARFDAVVVAREGGSPLETQQGTVAGTPAYMPPEQALGLIDRVGPASDVYALGAILYEILSDRPPFAGPDHHAVLAQVIHGPPRPAGRVPGPPIPGELVRICQRAMAREISARYPDANALASELGAWLDGAQRREQALKELGAAAQILPEIQQFRERAASLRLSAQQKLQDIKPFDPVAKKRPAWKLEEEAHRLEKQADLQDVAYLQRLQGALTWVHDLPEAHEKLADYYLEKHRAAEQHRDLRQAARMEVLLRAHDRGRYADWLEGVGSFSLTTLPPGASVEILRYEEKDRRLVPVKFQADEGGESSTLDLPLVTPIRYHSLPMGSYLLRVKAKGLAPAGVPILIERQQNAAAQRPGRRELTPLRLLPPRELLDDCLVPAGWCSLGGDAEAFSALPDRRVWVDAFVMKRYPVTNREYLTFLNDLLDQDREAEALRVAPRIRSGPKGEAGPLFFSRTGSGQFELGNDHQGAPIHPEVPVLLVDWHGAMAYARWFASRTGQPWRLPGELEWEKAARGVDRRTYPWGNFADPTWVCTQECNPDSPRPVPVDQYPLDESPYGVRGLAGNVREWCRDPWVKDVAAMEGDCALIRDEDPDDVHTQRVIRGGSYATRLMNARAACRYWDAPTLRSFLISFRLVYSLNAGES